MEDQAQDEVLRKEFCCPICLKDAHPEPLVFGCGHLLCRDCLALIFRPNPLDFKCPLCREIVTHVPYVCEMIVSVFEILFPNHEMDPGQANDLDVRARLSDALKCVLCETLLVRPVVTACGHVYCEGCVKLEENGSFKCVACAHIRWNWQPSVCYALKEVVDRFFPREVVQNNIELGDSSFEFEDSWWSEIELLHKNSMCILCRVSPIKGDCYTCRADECNTSRLKLRYCARCFPKLSSPTTVVPDTIIPHFPDHVAAHEIAIEPPTWQRERILSTASTTPADTNEVRRKSKVIYTSDGSILFTSVGVDIVRGRKEEMVWKRF